jgi:hypothetical protein
MLQRVAHPVPLVILSGTIVLLAASLAGPHLVPRAPIVENEVEKISMTKSASMPAASNASPVASLAEPQIARVANLSMYVGDVDASAAKVSGVARSDGGEVFSLDLAAGSGSVVIRVPSQRFDAAMNALVHVGTVRERSASAEDLSGDITDSSAKLRNLRRTESDILRIMDRSGSVDQILNVENQLSDVRQQIETLEADLKTMQRRVTYSTITVQLDAEPVAPAVRPQALVQLANAWRDDVASLGQLAIAVVAMLMWLVVFAPCLAVPAVIAWIVLARRKHAVRG